MCEKGAFLLHCLRGKMTEVQSGEGGSKMNIAIDPLILCGHSDQKARCGVNGLLVTKK